MQRGNIKLWALNTRRKTLVLACQPVSLNPDEMSLIKSLSGYPTDSNISPKTNSLFLCRRRLKCPGIASLKSFSSAANSDALIVHFFNSLHLRSAKAEGSIKSASSSTPLTLSGRWMAMPLGWPHSTARWRKSIGSLGIPNCETKNWSPLPTCCNDSWIIVPSSTRSSPHLAIRWWTKCAPEGKRFSGKMICSECIATT